MAPPRKIPKAELFATLAAYREAGNTCKEIARKLGGVYSHRYIQTLCGMLSAIHITGSVANGGEVRLNNGRDTSPCENVPAATEAKPSDTPEPGSH